MKHKFLRSLAVGLCVSCGSIYSAPSMAVIVTYADRASFTAASTGLSLIDFENIAPVDFFVDLGLGGSITLDNVTFTAGSQNHLWVNDANNYQVLYGDTYNLGAGDFLMSGAFAPASMTINLPNNVSAVGFDFNTFDFNSSQVLFTLSSGDVLALSSPLSTTPTFFGITSDTSITSIAVEISQGDFRNTLSLDTFAFGTAAPVPVPGAIWLLGSALGGLGLFIRRRVVI